MRYTKEHLEFLKNKCTEMTWDEVAEEFFAEFGIRKTGNNLQGVANRRGIKTGRTGKYKKGHTPFNKGKKGCFGGVETQFKKGHRPINFKEIGSERINVYGYTEIKTQNPNIWRLKHIVIWEEKYGSIPKGHCLIFLDQNKQNLSLENLFLVTRSELVRMNQNKLFSSNPEMTKVGLNIAKIHSKIGERKKSRKKRGR